MLWAEARRLFTLRIAGCGLWQEELQTELLIMDDESKGTAETERIVEELKKEVKIPPTLVSFCVSESEPEEARWHAFRCHSPAACRSQRPRD